MRPFGYYRPAAVADAIAFAQHESGSKYLGGGTNLIDLMKMGVEHPQHLVDISHLPLARIEERPDGMRIGALVRNSEVAMDHGWIVTLAAPDRPGAQISVMTRDSTAAVLPSVSVQVEDVDACFAAAQRTRPEFSAANRIG